MKITEKPIDPPPPPPVVYVLELSFEQLVTLGVLSHRHEITPNHMGTTFSECLPLAVRSAVVGRSQGQPDTRTSLSPAGIWSPTQ